MEKWPEIRKFGIFGIFALLAHGGVGGMGGALLIKVPNHNLISWTGRILDPISHKHAHTHNYA